MHAESNPVFDPMRFSLQFSGCGRKLETQLTTERLPDWAVRTNCEPKLSDEQETPTNGNIDEQWDQIKQTMHLAAGSACGSRSVFFKDNGSCKSH